MSSLLPQRPGEPDCRDYLRTGRCKYGDSCKYHHPSNVMSGGGIKGPIDPNEPLFPIRPNEQPCPYYLKHGTCKFGQTCKFHHPIHLLKQGNSPPSSSVMLNVNGNESTPPQNNHPAQIGEFTPLHFLPQRPGEQDCIYFLRNGRCKYGASCKYHHPRGRGRSVSAGSINEASNTVNFQIIPSQGSTKVFTLGQPQSSAQQQQATHILLSDGPIALMAVNQNSHYPRRNSNSMLSYACKEVDNNHTPMQQPQEQIYSEPSNNNHMNYDDWTRNSRLQESHYDDDVPEMPNHFYPRRVGNYNPTVPDRPNLPPQIPGDDYRMRPRSRLAPPPPPQHPAYFQNAHQNSEIHRRWGSNASLPINSNENNGAQEFSQEYSNEILSSSAPSHLGRSYLSENINRQQLPSRVRPSGGNRQEHHQGRNIDDGLSMMTSALLTMLDTPEENGQVSPSSQFKTNSYDNTYSSQEFDHLSLNGSSHLDLSGHNSVKLDPSTQSTGLDPPGLSLHHDQILQDDQQINSSYVHRTAQAVYKDNSNHSYNLDGGISITQNVYNMMPSHMEPNNGDRNSAHSTLPIPINQNDSDPVDSHDLSRWSPTCRDFSPQSRRNLERNAQSVTALQNTSSHATPKIGLYLS